MKYFNHKIIGIAMMCATVMACTDKYDCNLQVEKPEEVANSEYLASFDLLKSYITRDASSPFKFTANLSSTDFLKKDIAYSTILSNFDGIDIGGSITPVNSLKEDGSFDFGGMQLVADAVKGTDITLYGGTLCSNQGQRTAYYNELIQPIIIPFVPEKGKTVICDFENDELGKAYGMTGGSQAVVENDPDGKSGKALHVGTDDNKAAYSHPKFNVKLPEGRKLGDYVNLTIDMRIVNEDGIYGAGMRVFINGKEVRVMSEGEIGKFRYENLGFIFQEFNLLDSLTIFENIAVPLTLANVNKKEITQRVQEVAKKLNVEQTLDKFPNECSGGQRQRVAICRALVTNPKLIVADEPTGNLDSKNSHEILSLFKELNEKEGVSILMVTHDSKIASYSSKLLYIKDGIIDRTIEREGLSQKEYFYKIEIPINNEIHKFK